MSFQFAIGLPSQGFRTVLGAIVFFRCRSDGPSLSSRYWTHLRNSAEAAEEHLHRIRLCTVLPFS